VVTKNLALTSVTESASGCSLISLKSSVHDTENVSIRHVNIRILFFMMINYFILKI